jgi:hypothetical protein
MPPDQAESGPPSTTCLRPIKSETPADTKNTANSALAMPAVTLAAMPPNPKIPAAIAMEKKTAAQPSMVAPMSFLLAR